MFTNTVCKASTIVEPDGKSPMQPSIGLSRNVSPQKKLLRDNLLRDNPLRDSPNNGCVGGHQMAG